VNDIKQIIPADAIADLRQLIEVHAPDEESYIALTEAVNALEVKTKAMALLIREVILERDQAIHELGEVEEAIKAWWRSNHPLIANLVDQVRDDIIIESLEEAGEMVYEEHVQKIVDGLLEWVIPRSYGEKDDPLARYRKARTIAEWLLTLDEQGIPEEVADKMLDFIDLIGEA
jgi:hypothetical protein